MTALELARWQFGITTVYHFLFVPLTIGLALLVAVLQTVWYRTGSVRYLRLTKLFGKLFLINFAMGVVTGIVQEFQFGMNWSDYSRFVGDVFGAPLAIEGLLAFFLESTFLGLWIFGWDRLSKGVHLACIWVAALGTVLSAYFILAANSWMQNPVGMRIDVERGRAELTDIGALLTNKVLLVTFPHTIFAALMVGGAFMAGVAVWQLARGGPTAGDAGEEGSDQSAESAEHRSAFMAALKIGAVTTIIAGLGVVISGDAQGKIMTEVQPMKMAAAEALYETERPASFSLLTIGNLDGTEEVFAIKVPGLLSYLGTGSFEGEVIGINELQEAYEAKYGPGSYTPNIPLTYWNFRLMITAGGLAMAACALLLWVHRRGRRPSSPWLVRLAVVLPLLPLAGNAFGWVFTEMGRQPWLVFGLMPTASGVSPGTTTAEVATSLGVFTVLYGVLAVIEVGLLLKYIRAGLPPAPASGDSGSGSDSDSDDDADADAPLAFAY